MVHNSKVYPIIFYHDFKGGHETIAIKSNLDFFQNGGRIKKFKTEKHHSRIMPCCRYNCNSALSTAVNNLLKRYLPIQQSANTAISNETVDLTSVWRQWSYMYIPDSI